MPTLTAQITSKGGEKLSETEQQFTSLSLVVKNNRTLVESLQSSIKGDLLEGENAYYCETKKAKVDAIKRTCIKSLPNVLVIHLQRFEYNWQSGTRIKLNDYFEFPVQLDMQPFTAAGLRVQELGDAHRSELEPDGYYSYDLVGVLVHAGTAEAGHYYSYNKRRAGDPRRPSGRAQKDGFYIFDDTRVEHQDLLSNRPGLPGAVKRPQRFPQ
jgi:ubiquitin C-terminal hydrolase